MDLQIDKLWITVAMKTTGFKAVLCLEHLKGLVG